jgi:cytochrome c-type biogenesis protein CcmH/NrfG
MEKVSARELPQIPRAVAVFAIAATIVFGVEVYQNIGYSDTTGCPATADTFDNPVSWVAAPAANLQDGQGYQSQEILARDNCPS